MTDILFKELSFAIIITFGMSSLEYHRVVKSENKVLR